MVHKNWTMLSAEVCCLVEQGSHFRKFGEEFKNELSTKLYFLPSNRQNVVEVSEKKQNKMLNQQISKYLNITAYIPIPISETERNRRGDHFRVRRLWFPELKKKQQNKSFPKPILPVNECLCLCQNRPLTAGGRGFNDYSTKTCCGVHWPWPPPGPFRGMTDVCGLCFCCCFRRSYCVLLLRMGEAIAQLNDD